MTKGAGGRDAPLWEFDVPKGARLPYGRMAYLTVMNGDDFVLTLNCQQESKDQADAARQLLLRTAAPIRPTAVPHGGQVVAELIQNPRAIKQ